MKRLILCITILIVIISGSVSSLFLIKSKNQKLINTLDSITECAEDEKTDQALEKIKEFSRSWKDYYICVSFLVESSRLEDISESCAKLEALLLKNSEELYSECETIKYGIKLIYNNEFPYLHSIF